LISYLLITDAYLQGKPKHKINEESELVVISNLTDNYRYLVKIISDASSSLTPSR
jgi:hypothetical protein